MSITIKRLPAVQEAMGLSRSTIYQMVKEGLLTRPVTLGARAIGWPLSEVSSLNAARIAGKTNEEIRVLVVRLEAERKSAV